MFHLLKGIIWIVGSLVVLTFVLNYFDYEINWGYITGERSRCLKELQACHTQLKSKVLPDVRCDFDCVQFDSLIIK